MRSGFAFALAVSCTAIMFGSLASAADGRTANDEVDEIVVYGRAQTFYLEKDSRLGTKFDLDLVELPQSVQVPTKQLIIDQAARDITDLYRSIAGVSEFSYSGVTFRGFRDSSNVFYDGVRGDP